MATEQQMKTHVEPAVHFMIWARKKGFVLGTWDRDGQMTEVDDKKIMVQYAMSLSAPSTEKGRG